MNHVAPRMLASSGSTVASRLAAVMAATPVSPRYVAGRGSGAGPEGGAACCTAGT